MYGHHVHEAVIATGETHSGITINYVNEHYDDGAIILQEISPIEPGTTPRTTSATSTSHRTPLVPAGSGGFIVA
jgi:phosphoribosylglycinamide formyltransferase-1